MYLSFFGIIVYVDLYAGSILTEPIISRYLRNYKLPTLLYQEPQPIKELLYSSVPQEYDLLGRLYVESWVRRRYIS